MSRPFGRPIGSNGFDAEFKRLLDAARARRAKSMPLENRWYPEDREGAEYTTTTPIRDGDLND
ncbi:hypothetical protein LY56_02915 [Roseinatronobacter thiooxidans]|uniref:Uncharacterized protein n=1 Tax=Roseinatronobacter thiooxidans TaxID=121821 RepID=A0A2W7RN22_9RHOB|nr:hypothetical protein [Roseinatronobacter thiooxidans]PZX39382.1 hypothetical protein LY56_02915 [Roseinatronobacter thiooxidans]